MAKAFKISSYLRTLLRDLTHPNSLLNIKSDKPVGDDEDAESMLMAGANSDNKDDSDLESEYGDIPENMIMPHKRLLGWQHDIVFSSTDLDTVSWAAGTITLVDNTTYSIGIGNTGNMTAITYIYLNTAVSSVALQTTTVASDAVGAQRILIAVAQNRVDEATFQVFGGSGGALWTTENIAANTITANEIAANVVTVGELNFTPLISSGATGDVIATINASAEGITIGAENITLAGTTTFTAGWAAATNAESDIDVLNTTNAPAVAGATDDTAADAAQTTANAKSKVFRQTTPPGSGMTGGDIWFDTNDGDRPYTYNGSSWVETLTIIDGGKITTGTITAITFQTSASSYAGVKLTAASGITLYGQTMQVRDTSNNLYGYVGGYAGYFNFSSYNNRNMFLSAGSGIIYADSDVKPLTNASSSLGSSSYRWDNIYGTELNISSTVTIGGLINANAGIAVSSGLNCYCDATPNVSNSRSLGTSSYRWLTLKSKYVQLTSSITLGSTNALTDNGTIYFSGTHFYGRISGAWVQLD